MRKIVKRPDGSEEVIEGTPEEIREYERVIESSGKALPQKKPNLIKGNWIPDPPFVVKITEWEKQREKHWRYQPPSLLWMVSCPQCHRVSCMCQHGWTLSSFNRLRLDATQDV